MLRRGFALIAAALLLGCGGNEASTDPPPAGEGAEVADAAPASTAGPSTSAITADDGTVLDGREPPPTSLADETTPDETAEDRWTTTPLDQYWGYAAIDSQAYWDQDLAKEREVEELMATCMAENGFEYIPFPPPFHPAIVGESGLAAPELSPDEYRAQYGYGISTSIGEVHPALSSEPVVNPNGPIIDAMGPAEREAYFRALGGDERSITESTPLDERGCGGQADQQVRGVEIALYDQLGDERQQLRQRIDNDPRLVQATLEWSRCLGQAGHVYATPADIRQELFIRSDPFQMLGDPYEVLTQAEIDELTFEELEAVVAELSALSPEQQAVLDALQAFELAVAAVDYECGLPLDDVRYEVTVELEQQFVDEHLAQLEAIVAARGS